MMKKGELSLCRREHALVRDTNAFNKKAATYWTDNLLRQEEFDRKNEELHRRSALVKLQEEQFLMTSPGRVSHQLNMREHKLNAQLLKMNLSLNIMLDIEASIQVKMDKLEVTELMPLHPQSTTLPPRPQLDIEVLKSRYEALNWKSHRLDQREHWLNTMEARLDDELLIVSQHIKGSHQLISQRLDAIREMEVSIQARMEQLGGYPQESMQTVSHHPSCQTNHSSPDEWLEALRNVSVPLSDLMQTLKSNR
jgi:hypothetical protein